MARNEGWSRGRRWRIRVESRANVRLNKKPNKKHNIPLQPKKWRTFFSCSRTDRINSTWFDDKVGRGWGNHSVVAVNFKICTLTLTRRQMRTVTNFFVCLLFFCTRNTWEARFSSRGLIRLTRRFLRLGTNKQTMALLARRSIVMMRRVPRGWLGLWPNYTAKRQVISGANERSSHTKRAHATAAQSFANHKHSEHLHYLHTRAHTHTH